MNKLTFSAISLYNKCPHAYKLRYIDKIVKPSDPNNENNALELGSLVHEGLANHWLQHDLFEFIDIDENNLVDRKAKEIIKKYHEYFKEDCDKYAVESIEGQFENEFFKGQVDGVIIDKQTGERLLLEHKTASIVNDNYWYKLNLDLQIRLYAAAVGVNKVLYDVIKKPQLRIRKGETDEEFEERLKASKTGKIKRKEAEPLEEFLKRYYDAIEFERRIINIDNMNEAKDDALQIVKDVENKRFCRCRNNCMFGGMTCEYFELCTGQKSIDEYEHKEANSELVGGFIEEE